MHACMYRAVYSVTPNLNPFETPGCHLPSRCQGRLSHKDIGLQGLGFRVSFFFFGGGGFSFSIQGVGLGFKA